MRSGLRRAFRNQGPPVPLANQGLHRLSDIMTPIGGASSQTLQHCYGVMGTVFSCVQLLSSAVGAVEWQLFKKQPTDARRRYSTTDTGSDNRVQVTKHAALSLIENPNPFSTRMDLFSYDQTYEDLTGEYYWVIGRSGAMSFPTSIWPVRPDRMEPIPDAQNYISGWLYTSPDGGEKIPLAVNEVIQSALPNPLDPMHGLGPVQSILVQIDAYKYSAEWNRNFFLNSATPNGVITIPNSWDDTELKQFTDRWRETHRGVGRAQRIAILENGATFTPNQMSMKDMDFTNLQNLTRDTVREAFRMHKVMLGVSDDVNRANAQTGEEVFASWCVVPRLMRKRNMLNNVLLPMFGASDVEFDYVTPVPANREEDRMEMVAKTQAAMNLVNAGYDPHDVLETVGLPDMDVAEKATQLPALPPGWMPGTPAQTGEAPAESDDDTQKLAALLQKELRPYTARALPSPALNRRRG